MDEQGWRRHGCSLPWPSASKDSTRPSPDDLQAVPRLQPMVGGRLGLFATGPHLQRARHSCAGSRLSDQELEYVLERGAKLIGLRPGPANGRSQADPAWNAFWSRVQEADVPVAYHTYAGADSYDDAYNLLWRRQDTMIEPTRSNLRSALFGGDRTILTPSCRLSSPTFSGAIRGCASQPSSWGAPGSEYCLHVLDHAGLSIIERNIEAFGQRSKSDLPKSSDDTSGCPLSRKRTWKVSPA